MHIEKYNKNSVGHMFEHYERDPKIYKNQKHINPELKSQNYTLGNSNLKGMEKYKQILNTPGLKIHNRQDVITLVDVILTLPKPEYFPPEREREFFEVGYQFLLNKFCNGKEDSNFVLCVCHKDEDKNNSQPHIHFSFLPIIELNGTSKLCAKKVITRQILRTLHQEASAFYFEHFHFDVGIINGVTKEGNLTVPQLREQTKKYNDLVNRNEKLQSENEQLKLELEQNMHNLKIWQQTEDITPTFELQK